MINIDIFTEIKLTENEKKIFRKKENKLIAENVVCSIVLLAIAALFVYYSWRCNGTLSMVAYAGCLLIFIIVVILLKQIKGFHTDINTVKGVRTVITEKREGNAFFAVAKIGDDTFVQAECARKQYDKIIVNKTKGLFYLVNNEKIALLIA